jgi:hypothetical protein
MIIETRSPNYKAQPGEYHVQTRKERRDGQSCKLDQGGWMLPGQVKVCSMHGLVGLSVGRRVRTLNGPSCNSARGMNRIRNGMWMSIFRQKD